MLFRTHDELPACKNYPHSKAGIVRSTGLPVPVPKDNNRCYPAHLFVLFSFSLPSGNHLHVPMTAIEGQSSCITILTRQDIIRTCPEDNISRIRHNLNPLVNIIRRISGRC
jgi:hypothetical protein